jgi:hypothetical protein
MEIAIEAMKILIQQDYKKLSFSAKSNGNKSISEYIAEESFIFADAMLERENKKDDNHDK